MSTENVVSALIDNCVLSLTDTMRTVLKPVQVVVGGVQQTFQVLGFERRASPPPGQQWMRSEFECLPTLTRVAKEGRIRLCFYDELRHEAWRRPGSFPATLVGRLFSGVKFHEVDAAVERSYFFQMDIIKYSTNEQMVEFCKWLLACNVGAHLDALVSTGRFPPFLIKNLRNVDRYRTLCSGLAERQYPDAFHLWTAEVNGLDYFLTTDRKFIRAMTESSKLSLPCEPISPCILLEALGISDRDPFPHPENATIDIFGRPL